MNRENAKILQAQLTGLLEAFSANNKLILCKNNCRFSEHENTISFTIGFAGTAVEAKKLPAVVGRSAAIESGLAPAGTRVKRLWTDGEWYDGTILECRPRSSCYIVKFDDEPKLRYRIKWANLKPL